MHFHKCTQLWNHFPSQVREHHHHHRGLPCAPCSPFPHGPASTTSAGPPLIWFPWLRSNFPCPRTLYKWNHIAHAPLCLDSCMLHDVFEIYSCYCVLVINYVYCQAVFHYINRPPLAYSFSCWWTFGLFPDSGAFQFIVWKMLIWRNVIELHTYTLRNQDSL